ncbi:MAG TPA: hypothetical protein VD967_00990 [Candidatus Paceibacterota bacterium]|nr:hypothetical protein [Candidatus Paceibacterota bacterium]
MCRSISASAWRKDLHGRLLKTLKNGSYLRRRAAVLGLALVRMADAWARSRRASILVRALSAEAKACGEIVVQGADGSLRLAGEDEQGDLAAKAREAHLVKFFLLKSGGDQSPA